MTLNLFSIINVWSRNKPNYGKIGEVSLSLFFFLAKSSIAILCLFLCIRLSVLTRITIQHLRQTHSLFARMIYILALATGKSLLLTYWTSKYESKRKKKKNVNSIKCFYHSFAFLVRWRWVPFSSSSRSQ